MIEKIEFVDKIEVIQNGVIQVRTKTSFQEDGVEVSSSLHRHVIVPGDDYSKEDDRVQAICAATHTTEVIKTYKAAIAAQGV